MFSAPQKLLARLVPERLTTRVMIVGVMLASIMFAGASWMLYDARRTHWKVAERSAENLALGLERDIRETIEVFDLSLRTVVAGSQRPQLLGLDADLRQAILFDGAIAAQAYGGAIVTDEAGWVIHDSMSVAPRRINVADRDYFRAHQRQPNAGLIISRPLRSRGDGQWSVALTRRVNHPDGSFAGVAAGALRLDHFVGLFSNLDLGEQGIVSLFTTAGELVVRQPYVEGDIGRNVSGAEVFRHLARARSGTFEAAAVVDGVPRLYAYRQVGSLPFVVSVGLSRSAIHAAWNRMALVVGAAMSLLLLVAAALALRLRRELRRRSRAEGAARRAMTAAQESATYLRLVTDGAGDLLLTVDWEGVRRFVSPSGERLLGRSAAEMLGRNWLDAVHPDDRAQLAAALSDMRSDVAPGPLTLRLQRKDGVWRWFEALGGALPNGSGAVFAMRDVTERKRVEDALQLLNENLEARVDEAVAAQEAVLIRTGHAERMQVLGQLAGGIAHDFNNVLQAVTGCTDLIERYPADAAHVCRLTRLIREASTRGAAVTRRLLAFSRRDELRAEAVEVTALLSGLQEILSYTLGGTITVRTEVAAMLPPLLADKGQLETVLLNLATNARDAMTDGGMLILTAADEVVPADHAGRLAALTPGRYVRLRVADTGAGMNAATLARVTEPFFTTKPVGQGTGLGLSMAKGFAEQSGGWLEVESEPGQGTVVTLWLPQAGVAASTATVDEAARQFMANMPRVLLVDDDPIIREIMAERLEERYSVLAASNAAEALALLSAGEAVDALVTDLSMPGMDGLTLIRKAQQRRAGLPAVLLTGYADDNACMALDGATSGAFSLLRKPVTFSQLSERIDALLEERRNTLDASNERLPAA